MLKKTLPDLPPDVLTQVLSTLRYPEPWQMVQALGRLAGVSRALKTLLQPLLATTIRQELTAWRDQ